MDLDEFLSETPPTDLSRRRCRCCRHPRRAEMDRALREIAERRALPPDDSRHLSPDVWPWYTLHARFLVSEFARIPDAKNVLNHAEKHLGLEGLV